MHNYKLLLTVSIAASLLMVGVGMIVALLPQRVLSLSGSVSEVGYLASIFALSYLLVQLPVGYLADRFGAKLFLVFGYLLCSLSGLVFFFSDTPESIFLGRFIQGAGEAPIWALGPALLSLAYPSNKGRVIGIYNAAIHAGLTLGPLLGLVFFSSQSSWPFLLFAVLCAIGGVIVFAVLPRTGRATRPSVVHTPDRWQLLKLLGYKDPLFTLLAILLYGACYGVFLSVLPATLMLSKDYGSFDIGVYFALFYLAISVSQLIVGPLSDRHGRPVFMIAGLAMAAVGTAIFGYFTLPFIFAPLMLASLGLGVFCVASIAHLNECVPDQLKGTISGSYYLAWGLGYFLGPLLIGWADTMLNPMLGYGVLAMFMAMLAIALLWVRKRPSYSKQ